MMADTQRERLETDTVMERYDGRDLNRYLGSRTSAVGVVLFFLGAGGLLVCAVAMASGFSWRAESKALLAIPLWSIVAVPLGFAMRRHTLAPIVAIFGQFWLAIALAALFFEKFFG